MKHITEVCLTKEDKKAGMPFTRVKQRCSKCNRLQKGKKNVYQNTDTEQKYTAICHYCYTPQTMSLEAIDE